MTASKSQEMSVVILNLREEKYTSYCPWRLPIAFLQPRFFLILKFNALGPELERV